MNKVFCKNCKYLHIIKEPIENGLSKNILYGCAKDAYADEYFYCNERNKNGDCKYYEKKWWKF
jgi:hypothetical protein